MMELRLEWMEAWGSMLVVASGEMPPGLGLPRVRER